MKFLVFKNFLEILYLNSFVASLILVLTFSKGNSAKLMQILNQFELGSLIRFFMLVFFKVYVDDYNGSASGFCVESVHFCNLVGNNSFHSKLTCGDL